MSEAEFRCGFVAIVGAPNAGKSTFLNRRLGVKIAATSAKPQTTRTRILGVHHQPGAQVIFLDTPGIHQPRSRLHQSMVQTALGVLAEVDVILWLVDAAAAPEGRLRPEEEVVLERLAQIQAPLVIGLNKIDLIDPPRLLPLMDLLAQRRPAEALVPISALSGDGLDILTGELVKRLPHGPALFPEETLTDQPERVIAAEFVREKVFRLTGQEVPYGVAVEVTEFTERPTGGLYIRAVIHVERESHKGILIGAKGAKLKAIGQAARTDLEALLGAKVFLELFVRVEPDWTKQDHLIRRMGYGQ